MYLVRYEHKCLFQCTSEHAYWMFMRLICSLDYLHIRTVSVVSNLAERMPIYLVIIGKTTAKLILWDCDSCSMLICVFFIRPIVHAISFFLQFNAYIVCFEWEKTRKINCKPIRSNRIISGIDSKGFAPDLWLRKYVCFTNSSFFPHSFMCASLQTCVGLGVMSHMELCTFFLPCSSIDKTRVCAIGFLFSHSFGVKRKGDHRRTKSNDATMNSGEKNHGGEWEKKVFRTQKNYVSCVSCRNMILSRFGSQLAIYYSPYIHRLCNGRQRNYSNS